MGTMANNSIETDGKAAGRKPALRPIIGYLPVTFLERGAAVPFTTPQLAAARARPAARRQLELLVPNPSGGQGMYVLAWEDVGALCRPTVFDTRLVRAVAAQQGVTPARIREAATEIAAEGLAGRAARAAAMEAREAGRRGSLVANFDLLMELVRQVEPPGSNPVAPEHEEPLALERRARAAVARIAPGLGQSAQAVANQLEQLAGLYSPLGVGPHATTARAPTLIRRLMRLREEALAWSQAHPEESGGEALLLATVAELTIGCARVTLGAARKLTADMRGLLVRWGREPDVVAELLARPEWLLDGWERVLTLWETAGEHLGRSATLLELVGMIPVIPKEAADWVGGTLDLQSCEVLRHRRKVLLMEDWRTGYTVMDLIARNEALLRPLLIAEAA